MRGQEEAFIPWIDKYGELLRVCGIHENVGTSEYARPFSTVSYL